MYLSHLDRNRNGLENGESFYEDINERTECYKADA